jgi:hypothetical protein
MRRLLVLVVVTLLISLAAMPALADRVAKSDGEDTRGPLDIATIVHKHRKGHPNVFVHKIVMQRDFRRRALRSAAKHDGVITVTFDVAHA